MKVKLPSELNERERELLQEFIKESINFTEEEYSYLMGENPMTYDMYRHLAQRLLEIGCDNHYSRFIQSFPEFLSREAEDVLQDILKK